MNTLSFAYSANVITVTRGGTTPELNDQLNAAIPGIFPDSIKEYGADRGHPIFYGRGSYGDDLQNMAPFKNNQDLFVLKDDYSVVLGKHFFKAGIVGSYNKKNEDVFDQGSAESSQFGDAVGLTGNGDTTGNVLADLLLRGMAFDFTENAAERSIQQRWRDVEAYVADSWKIHPRVTLDYGLRWSRFESPYDLGDTISSWDASAFDPALGSDPCNGMLLPPGSNACQAGGLSGGKAGPNRALAETNNYFAPRLGLAWDVHGNGKMARAGGPRPVLRARVAPERPEPRLQPALQQHPARAAAPSTATPSPSPEPSRRTQGIPQYGLDTAGKFGYNWQWNVTRASGRSRATPPSRSATWAARARACFAPTTPTRCAASDRPATSSTPAADSDARAALRPYGVFGNENIAILDHGGNSIYHSLQTQLVSRFGHGSQFQASYTFSRAIGDVTLAGGENGIGASSVSLLENRGLDRGLTQTHRKHIFNASLVFVLPELDGQVGLREERAGRLGDRDHRPGVLGRSGHGHQREPSPG